MTDSWFGNHGLWSPQRKCLGNSAHMISRLRSNNNLYERPETPVRKGPGRPRIHGHKLGNSTILAQAYQEQARQYTVNLYGKNRAVLAYDRVVMLKTLKCPVRVVWIYRKTQWVALFSFAFSDVRRLIAPAAFNQDFAILCPVPRQSMINSLVTALMGMAA